MMVTITQQGTLAKVVVSFGGMLLPPGDQAVEALADAQLALSGGCTVSPVIALENDGTALHALVLGYALHLFQSGAGAVILPSGIYDVWYVVGNFTGAPIQVWPQANAAFLRSTVNTPYVLADGEVIRVIATSPTQAFWF